MDGKIRKVAVIGEGTLGVQIALMAVHYGNQVKTFDPDEKSFARVLQLIRQRIANSGRKTLPPFENLEEGAGKVQRCASLERSRCRFPFGDRGDSGKGGGQTGAFSEA